MPPKSDLVFHNVPNAFETIHTAFNVKLSPTKPDKDLSPTHRPLAPIIEDWVSDSENDSKAKIPQNDHSFVQPTDQIKHPRPSVQPVETSILAANPKTATPNPKRKGNIENRKACFVHVVPTIVLTQSKLVPVNDVRLVTTAVPKTNVTRSRQAKPIVTKPHSPPRKHINRSPSLKASSFSLKVTAAKAPMGNPQHALKDKGVIDSGCSRYMIGNMSYLFDFEAINGGYVAFGGNTKGDIVCIFSHEFKLLDKNQLLLRVLRENNMYNVDLKNIVPSGDLTCLFAKAILDESNLWHRRLGHINFKAMIKLVRGNFVRGLTTKVFENDHTCVACKKDKQHRASCKTKPVSSINQPLKRLHMDLFGPTFVKSLNKKSYCLVVTDDYSRNATFDEKEPEFEGRKPESEVNVSLSSKFEDFSDNSINEDNAAGSLVPTVGQISTNSTNTFSTAGPFNVAVCPTHGKSLYVDSSQLLDDPNMPKLEDITYSDDEEDVGAEDDFTNLETTITMQKVWVLVYFPIRKRAIGTKWVFRNKKDERGIVVRNKARLVALGHAQEEGIDYKEVFSPIARIKAIRLFLAYASFMGFMVYQMDVKSAFLYRAIEEEVCICQPLGFKDLDYPDKVYKVVKAIYSLHQAPRAWYETLANYFLENGFQIGKIDQTLFIKRWKIASTPIDIEKPLFKDPDDKDVDMHTYRLMIGSLMYLTSSRPEIMFAVYTYARFQVTPKASHLHTVKRIFRYLKGKPHLGLWYPKDSSFNLVAYSDSNFAGVNDVTRLQALFDKKKVIITEATIRDVVRLNDAEGIDCLPNEEIFTEKQVGDLSSHSTKYSSPTLTQKVFANIKRVVKGFSRVETPLFKGMIVAQQVGKGVAEVNVEDVSAAGVAHEGVASVADEGVASVANDDVTAAVNEPSPTPPTQPPPPSQDIPSTSQGRIIADMDTDQDITLKDVAAVAKDVQYDKIKECSNVQGRQAKLQAQIYQIDLEHAEKVLSMQNVDIEPVELQEVVEVVTTAKLITRVVIAASATITAAAPALTTAPSAARRRKGVVIRDPEETATPSTIIHSKAKSKDKGKGILVEEPKPLKKQAQIEQDEG
nr:hypothetical protein [Tanacetum cinerariifolium]